MPPAPPLHSSRPIRRAFAAVRSAAAIAVSILIGVRSIPARAGHSVRAISRALVRVRSAVGDRRRAAARGVERAGRILARQLAGWLRRVERAAHRLAAFARRAALTFAAVLVVSTVMATAALAATTLYAQFGAPRVQANAVSWADRTPTYGRVECAQCHADKATAAATAKHSSLGCESCHTPTVLHPGPVPGVVSALPIPKSDVCATCHASTPGRPAKFAVVDTATHYQGADCLRCHDPHTSTAVAPPIVSHPRADLPPCTTCHSPGGLKRYPAGHQPAADAVCLSCHKPREGSS